MKVLLKQFIFARPDITIPSFQIEFDESLLHVKNEGGVILNEMDFQKLTPRGKKPIKQ